MPTQQHQRAQSSASAVEEAKRAFNERVSKAREANPDIDMRVSDDVYDCKPSFTLPRDEYGRPVGYDQRNAIADEMIRSENPVGIARYLSDHPEEFEKIVKMGTARDIARAIAKIEDRADDATSGNPPSAGRSVSKPTSKAPAPVRPVTGSPQTESGELDDDAPLSAFVRRFGDRELKLANR